MSHDPPVARRHVEITNSDGSSEFANEVVLDDDMRAVPRLLARPGASHTPSGSPPNRSRNSETALTGSIAPG